MPSTATTSESRCSVQKEWVVSENPVGTNVRVFGREAINGDTLKEFFVDRYADSYVSEIDAFVAVVRGEPANYPNLADGREALSL